MPLIKVWNHDRTKRKIVKVTDLKGLLEVGGRKLEYDAEDLKACLEVDGTEIDDEEIFQDLFQEKEASDVIMILPTSFDWAPAHIQSVHLQSDSSTIIASPDISLVSSPSPTPAEICSTEEELETESMCSFTIPWHLLPPKFMKACQENKRPDKRQRNSAVITICNEILSYQPRPTRKFIEQVAKDIVKRFPTSLKSVIGKEHEYLFCQLENRINNESRMKNKVTLKKHLTNESTENENRKITDCYGCVEWQPELPKNETMESLQDIRNHLVEQYLISSDDEQQIALSLDQTYCLQRLKINSKCTIGEFKEEWPYLNHTKYLLHHANKLLGMNLLETWRNALDEKLEKFYTAIRTTAHKKPKLNKHLQELQEAVIQNHSRQPEEASFFETVMLSFNEDPSSLLQYFEKTSSVDEIKSQLKQSPVIAVLGSSLFSDPEVLLFVDNEEVGDREKFSTSVVLFFSIFYTYNLQYPEGASLTMEFLQRVFFKINPWERRSLKLKKRARTTVNPKVLGFVNFLQSQDSVWNI